ncbi:hypothetical protein D3C84_1073030 [compost metagenome]
MNLIDNSRKGQNDSDSHQDPFRVLLGDRLTRVVVDPRCQRLAIETTAKGPGTDFYTESIGNRDLGFTALGPRFLRKIKSALDAIVEVAQGRGANPGVAQIHSAFT